MIPKLIHFIWLGSPLPKWAERNIEEFRKLNPEHEIRLHTEDSAPARYASVWRDDLHPSTKSDLIRYDLLREYGGWYFDVDYWPARPLADAERAYGLDGSKLFCCWMNNPRINNGVLACAPGCKALDVLDSLILAGGILHGKSGRTMFGPPVITKINAEHPDLICAAPYPWFHGIRDVHAAKVWRRCVLTDNSGLHEMIPQTGGQLPFAFHMWAHTHGDRIDSAMDPRPLIAICGVAPERDDGNRPYPHIAQACEKLGYRAEIVPWTAPNIIDQCTDIPKAVFVWNGLKGHHLENANEARKVGAKTIFMEYGFFDRDNHFQADAKGLLHNSSWASDVSRPAPYESEERLAQFVTSIKPTRRDRPGYILVLGQIPNDSQLFDSELKGPIPLQKAVARSLPSGVTAYFRPHPSCSHVDEPVRRRPLPLIPVQTNEANYYRTHKSGNGLMEALKNAKFVITINSNAIIDCLIEGVPVLAFGPSLAINAGAVHATSVATLPGDIQTMMRGWCPVDGVVENYLRWLAAKQYRYDEFADAELIAELLESAGIERLQ
jgi:hypothetical protein